MTEIVPDGIAALHADHITVRPVIGRRPQTGWAGGPEGGDQPIDEPLIQIDALGLIPVLEPAAGDSAVFNATDQAMLITPEAAYTLIVDLTEALQALAAYGPPELEPEPRVVDLRPQAWENEHAITFAWNTHDADLAVKLHEEWMRQNGFDPFSEEFAVDADYWSTALLRWADPELAGPDVETWPAQAVSLEPVDGWIPYLVKL